MEKLTYDTLHDVTDGVGNGALCPLQRVVIAVEIASMIAESKAEVRLALQQEEPVVDMETR